MEQTVRRSELRSPESSPPPSPAIENIEKLKALGNFDFVNIPETTETTDINKDLQDDDDELAFQLFAPSIPSGKSEPGAASLQKIRLKSPTPTTADAGFVKPMRALEYYLIPSASGQDKENFQIAAVTGEAVVKRSHSPWPGSTYAWKVTNLPASSLSKAAKNLVSHEETELAVDDETSKHKRPGKKARIKTRTKLAAEREKAEKSKVEDAEREKAEREKKTRRNREKQAKKRAREKAKRAGGGDGDETIAAADEMEIGED